MKHMRDRELAPGNLEWVLTSNNICSARDGSWDDYMDGLVMPVQDEAIKPGLAPHLRESSWRLNLEQLRGIR